MLYTVTEDKAWGDYRTAGNIGGPYTYLAILPPNRKDKCCRNLNLAKVVSYDVLMKSHIGTIYHDTAYNITFSYGITKILPDVRHHRTWLSYALTLLCDLIPSFIVPMYLFYHASTASTVCYITLDSTMFCWSSQWKQVVVCQGSRANYLITNGYSECQRQQIKYCCTMWKTLPPNEGSTATTLQTVCIQFGKYVAARNVWPEPLDISAIPQWLILD